MTLEPRNGYFDRLIGACIALTLWGVSAFAEPPRYIYRELPIPDDQTIFPIIRGGFAPMMLLNGRGDAVAHTYWPWPDPVDGHQHRYPILWTNGQPHPFFESSAIISDLNDKGNVSGGRTGSDDYNRGFVSNGVKLTDLTCPPSNDGFRSYATIKAMNNPGVVVGSCNFQSVVWAGESIAFIYGSQAIDVTDEGNILGYNSKPFYPTNFLLNGTNIILFGGPSELAVALGDDDFVIGFSKGDSPVGIGWDNGVRREFPRLPRSDQVYLADLWDANEVVGHCYRHVPPDPPYDHRATIWLNGLAYELQSISAKPDNTLFFHAWGINRHGHIITEGYISSGPNQAFLRQTIGLLLRIESILAFEFFAPCVAGPSVDAAGGDCEAFDRNLDGAVDLRDYAAIQNNFR